MQEDTKTSSPDQLFHGLTISKISNASAHPTHGILYKQGSIDPCVRQTERRRKWLSQQKE